MRILLTIPHYYRADRIGFHGSRRKGAAAARQAALLRCILALHHHYGADKQGILDGPSRYVHAVNSAYGHELTIVVCVHGDAHVLEGLPTALYERVASTRAPQLLGYTCHEILRDGLGQYDYYGYLEDDIHLFDPLFFQKLTWFTGFAGDHAVLQPNRYERMVAPSFHKVYMDGPPVDTTMSTQFQDMTHYPTRTATLMGQTLTFERVNNPHSGCFFLNAWQMAHWAEQSYFLDGSAAFFGPLESAATLGLMKTFDVYKPARQNAGFLEVEHLDLRYDLYPDNSVWRFKVRHQPKP